MQCHAMIHHQQQQQQLQQQRPSRRRQLPGGPAVVAVLLCLIGLNSSCCLACVSVFSAVQMVNPSFEATPITAGYFVGSADGWTVGADSGTMQPNLGPYASSPATDGVKVAYVGPNSFIRQLLNLGVQSFYTYTFSFDIIDRPGFTVAGYVVNMRYGPITQFTPVLGDFNPDKPKRIVVTFTTGLLAVGIPGALIEIEIANVGNAGFEEFLVDQVYFTASGGKFRKSSSKLFLCLFIFI